MRIGLILPKTGDSRGAQLAKLLKKQFPGASFTGICFSHHLKNYWVKKPKTKKSYMIGPNGKEDFLKVFAKVTEKGKFDAYVCVDIAFAHHALPERDAKALGYNTDKLSGMLLDGHGETKVPILFLFDPTHMYMRYLGPEHNAVYVFMAKLKIQKLWRRMQGLPSQEKPVKYVLPQTTEDLNKLKNLAAQSRLIAYDIETSGGYISCIGFACEMDMPYTLMFVIPLYVNIPDTEGMYWKNQHAFEAACDTIGNILANDVPKVAHNGGFDISHLFRYGWYVNNYIYDTMVMMHSAWPTLPRALYVGASLFLDNYRFWKDDAKEVGEDGKTRWRTPNDVEGTWRYWNYNGLDCVNTLELCLAILRYWKDNPREDVMETYLRQMMLEFGPCLYMSMVGISASRMRQIQLALQLENEAEANANALRQLIGEPEFNPNSSQQVAALLYDDLQAPPTPRKGRTTDKTLLKTVAEKHPIYADVINHIAAAKEPANNASKYGRNMEYKDGELFLYQMKSSVTVTRRLSSSKHNIGFGTNMQNVPKPMRVVCHANPNEYLVASDYSQSDSYFVAFESQDETMIETVLDDRDTHAVHVEFFFGVPYDEVVRGNAAKEDWVVHPVTGLRQIIKKVTHGTNYDMQGDTMLINIGRDAALTMAKSFLQTEHAPAFMRFIGLDMKKPVEYYIGNATLFSGSVLTKSCDFAQQLYYKRYKTLAKWKQEAVTEAKRDNGVIKMFGGSSTHMFCNPSANPRFVPAAYGQGGTAGNINNAMLRLYYLRQDMWDAGFRMLIQVHDELVCAIPRDQLWLVEEKVKTMEQPCVIHGREFVVPVEAELSISWDPKNTVVWEGKDAMDYHAAIAEAEAKTAKKYGPITLGE